MQPQRKKKVLTIMQKGNMLERLGKTLGHRTAVPTGKLLYSERRYVSQVGKHTRFDAGWTPG